MRLLLVLVAIVIFGYARLPLERAVPAQDRQLHLSLREQIGQLGFAAALSGFRSIVADFVFIRAHTAWENTEWSRLLLLLREATELQPRSLMFWDVAAWHMAWNASAAVMNDDSQPLTTRTRLQRQYFELGRDFLTRGIAYNPDKPQLYEAMARLYQQKYNNHLRASQYYAQAARLPGAMSYDRRFSAYELSYCEGREREAYQKLRALYDEGDAERLPTLIKRLKYLEQKIDIPQDQRISDSA